MAFVADALCGAPAIVFAAVRQRGAALMVAASPPWERTATLYDAAVRRQGTYLRDAGPMARDDTAIVRIAIVQDHNALNKASDRHRSDKAFMTECVTKGIACAAFLPALSYPRPFFLTEACVHAANKRLVTRQISQATAVNSDEAGSLPTDGILTYERIVIRLEDCLNFLGLFL